MRASVQGSLSNEAMLHGIRTESMFGALVISLGVIALLKQEDAGEIYASDDKLKVPDYRLLLSDGSQMLVEVKNFSQANNAMRSFELDEEYLDGLVRYSKAMSCNLLLAIYWAKWNMWTLVRPETFKSQGKKKILDMRDAMKANHMSSLGDRSIGTTFPLSLVMHADKTKPRTLGGDNTGTFTISSVEICCAGHLLTNPVEKRIATHLMFYGKWEYEAEPRMAGNEIEAVEHRWTPATDHEQGFEIVASLSEMFSTSYKLATQDEGKVVQLRLEVAPGLWGRLIPEDYKSERLPLWRFTLEPSEPDDEADV